MTAIWVDELPSTITSAATGTVSTAQAWITTDGVQRFIASTVGSTRSWVRAYYSAGHGVDWEFTQTPCSTWGQGLVIKAPAAQVGLVIKAPAILSAETAQRYAQAQREDDERRRTIREQAEQAKAKARALLLRNLNPAQREDLENRHYFDLAIGDKTYRIRQGTHGNVRLVEGGRETWLYCAQPDGVPDEDAMLAQVLLLKTDEAAFLGVANKRAV